jgi:hypothetical protein
MAADDLAKNRSSGVQFRKISRESEKRDPRADAGASLASLGEPKLSTSAFKAVTFVSNPSCA